MSGKIKVTCEDSAALEVYGVLRQDFGIPDSKIDSGYPVLDYNKPQSISIMKKGDAEIQCEEIWEKAFNVLDTTAPSVHWEEDSNKAKDDLQKKLIEHYQKLREKIEGGLKRPIPWVIQAPTSSMVPNKKERDKLVATVTDIRKRVNYAIETLNKILANETGDKKTELLTTGLFWFVYAPVLKDLLSNKEEFPREVEDSLKNKGLDEFIGFLKENGGLGMSKIDKDAPIERTVFETLTSYAKNQKLGGCTEQSKVLYAVLRMAGIDAFFVEPRLSIEYFAKNRLLKEVGIPLPSHAATGVGILIKGEPWILDMALKVPEADYASDYPYWRLSLRHFFMTDLVNVGIDYRKKKKIWYLKKAKEYFEQALKLGSDSTVYNAMIGYATILSILKPRPSKDIKVSCKTVEDCSRMAYKINQHNTQVVYNYAVIVKSEDLYLDVLRLDPRYVEPYKRIIYVLNDYLNGDQSEYEKYWKQFADLIKDIAAKYTVDKNNKKPLFHEVLHNSFNKLLSDRKLLKKISPRIIEKVRKLEKEMAIDKEGDGD